MQFTEVPNVVVSFSTNPVLDPAAVYGFAYSGLPAGLVTSQAGLFTVAGSTAAPGTYSSAGITATDNYGARAASAFQLVVKAQGVYTPGNYGDEVNPVQERLRCLPAARGGQHHDRRLDRKVGTKTDKVMDLIWGSIWAVLAFAGLVAMFAAPNGLWPGLVAMLGFGWFAWRRFSNAYMRKALWRARDAGELTFDGDEHRPAA